VDSLVEELMALLSTPDDDEVDLEPQGRHEPLLPVATSPQPSAAASRAALVAPSATARGESGSPPAGPIQKIRFRRYKRLSSLDLELGTINILTGANNAGKSTALGALRVLASGLNAAKRIKPSPGQTPDGRRPVYHVPTDGLPVSLENVHTDLADEDTTVGFVCDGGFELKLWFPVDGGCRLYVNEAPGRTPRSPKAVREAFPWDVVHVPVLGPLEHDEVLLKEATVKRGLSTHRAARHFRNFWHHFPDGFERFASRVSETWPGMVVERPELKIDPAGSILHMYCREERMTRELYWAGFGFQIWCQLLTHVTRARPGDILVVDEPETYLHPRVQRRLLSVLRKTSAQVVMATHSASIVMSAGPREVVPMDSSKRRARGLARPASALASQLGLRD